MAVLLASGNDNVVSDLADAKTPCDGLRHLFVPELPHFS